MKPVFLTIFCLLLSSLAAANAAEVQDNDVEDTGLEMGFVPVLSPDIQILPSSRIVGGRNANPGQFPHQVSLRIFGSHTCGGSIISRNFVVTAAHCVSSGRGGSTQAASSLTVRAGSNLLNSGGTIVRVSQVIVHENYRNFDNDIALVRLATPLTLGDRIRAIPLATADLNSGSSVVISGWGRLRNGGGSLPSQLQYNTLNAISNDECRRRIGNAPNAILCLAHRTGNGACQGDSGGPAVFNGRLVGVTNFVINNCGSSAPDGYAKISVFNSWIRQHSDL